MIKPVNTLFFTLAVTSETQLFNNKYLKKGKKKIHETSSPRKVLCFLALLGHIHGSIHWCVVSLILSLVTLHDFMKSLLTIAFKTGISSLRSHPSFFSYSF